MNQNHKIVLLAAIAILLLLPACTRPAPRPTGVATPTEAIFPAFTLDPISEVQTQTAAALVTPLATNTIDVSIATSTPDPAAPAPEATQPPTGGGDPGAGGEAGGGVVPTPTTAVAAPLPVSPVSRPPTHTIVKGEFPYCIARRYDLDPVSFLSLNGLSSASQVSIGTVLQIPSTGNWNTANYGSRALRSHPTTYTVAAGETVDSIACKFGDVAPEQILQANGFGSAADVTAGKTINIP